MKFVFPAIITALAGVMSAVADNVEYFDSPSDRSVFQKGAEVHCSVNDMPDPHGHRVTANLYREDGNGMPLYAVKTWDATSLDSEDENEQFDAFLGPDLPSGRYYVQLDVEGEYTKDHVRSRTFGVCNSGSVEFDQVDSPSC